MRMPPVRELSIELGVNPNTAQRSLAELEREGLVFTERTAGRFITKDKEKIREVKGGMAAEYAGQFYRKMRAIGFVREEIVEIVRGAADSEEAQT
jgi:DNA-binding transcriptional regulator YhcF (GntR family)